MTDGDTIVHAHMADITHVEIGITQVINSYHSYISNLFHCTNVCVSTFLVFVFVILICFSDMQ